MRRLLPFLLLLLVLIAAGCRESAAPTPTPDPSIVMTLEIDPQPAAVGDAVLIVSLTDPTGAPITGATVAATGDMNHAGMVPVNGEATGGDDGLYRIPFRWTMGGDWFVIVEATLPDGRSTRQTFDLSVQS